MQDKKLFGTTTVGSKGQVVIPAAAREELAIDSGDRLYAIGMPCKGAIILLKEDMLEKHIETLTLHVEVLNELKNNKK